MSREVYRSNVTLLANLTLSRISSVYHSSCTGTSVLHTTALWQIQVISTLGRVDSNDDTSIADLYILVSGGTC